MRVFILAALACALALSQTKRYPEILTNGAQTAEGPINYCGADTGAVNVIACSNPAGQQINAYVVGDFYSVTPANTNTGTATLAIDGLAAKPIKKQQGTAFLVAGDIVAGSVITVVYDGTYFELQSPTANVFVSGPGTTTTGNLATWSATNGSSLGTGIAAPSGAIVGTSDTQTLTNKSIGAAEITSGNLSLSIFPTIASNTLLGNASGSSAVPAALSATNLNSILATAPASSSTFGVVKTDGSTITSTNGVLSSVSGSGSVVGVGQFTGQSANLSAQSLATVPATSYYSVCMEEGISQAATTSSTLPTMQVQYVSGFDGVTRTINVGSAGLTSNSTATATSECANIYAQANGSVNYLTTGYASSGGTAMNYYVAARLTQLNTPTASQWSMGYWWGYGGTVPDSSINWAALTHVIYIGLQANTNGTVTYLCASEVPCSESASGAIVSNLVSLAHANGAKVIVEVNCCGDWPNATNSTNLSTFVSAIMQYVNAYGLDGVSLDWENGSYNFPQITNLLSGLRTQLGSKLIVMTCIAQFSTGANFAALQSYLDAYSVMSYDAGNANPTWFNNAVASDNGSFTEGSVDFNTEVVLVSRGVPINKILASIAFYGEVQTGATGPRQAVNVSTAQINYNRIVANYPSYYGAPTIDGVAQAAWFSPGANTWVNWDSAATITAIVNYAKNKGMRGWFIWALDQDYISTQTPSHPLLQAVQTAMGR